MNTFCWIIGDLGKADINLNHDDVNWQFIFVEIARKLMQIIM